MLPRNCSGHLYDVLQVSPDCSTGEISRRYRALALRLHPDRTGGLSVEAFQEIEEAHRILHDPAQRSLYDTLGREQMKLLDASGVFASLGVLRAARGGLTLLGFITLMGLAGLILVGLRVESRLDWGWGLIMLPFWMIAPIFVGIGIIALIVAARMRTVILTFIGLQMLMIVAAAIITTLALSGLIQPPSRAFIPWAIWYALLAARSIYFLIPSVYAKNRKRMSAMLNDSIPPSMRSSSEWSWKDYVMEAAHEVCEIFCVIVFICLAYKRTAQGSLDHRSAQSTNRNEGEILSFWVVFAPLIIYFGIWVTVQAVYTCLCPYSDGDKPQGNSPDEPYSALGETERNRQTAEAKRRPSCGMRLLNVILAVVWPASGLYMVCMWAAKLEWEYNLQISGNALHPTFFVACIPLLAGLTFLTLTSFCMCCGLGFVLDESTEAEGVIPEQRPVPPAGGDERVNTQAFGCKPSNPVFCYQSVDQRDDADQAALDSHAPNASGKNTKTLEDID
ncbi:unnamed protein product [Phytomonas sp. Hart1]|nr:unnamed protein product [Phytomonas sp. Hart1]|eukprot:CCW67546.1 unnamed protein product [Phytomonas sp. isolate Hart1]